MINTELMGKYRFLLFWWDLPNIKIFVKTDPYKEKNFETVLLQFSLDFLNGL